MTDPAKPLPRWTGSRAIVTFRLADEERRELEEAACAAGLPMRRWLRIVALAVARSAKDERKAA